MASKAATPSKRVRAFRSDESGSFTIEAVLWLPVFMFLFCLIADASLMFGKQAQVLRIVQDANRALSVGRIMTDTDAEAYIQQQMAAFSENAIITTTVVGGVISSTVEIPAGDLTATGLISSFDSLVLSVTAQHMSEA